MNLLENSKTPSKVNEIFYRFLKKKFFFSDLIDFFMRTPVIDVPMSYNCYLDIEIRMIRSKKS